MPCKILVVDDSFVMRSLVKKILDADNDLQVVGEAGNGQEALDAIPTKAPDVVLLDIEMPVMDGLECLKRLRLQSRAKVIILSSVAQVGSPQAMEARKQGAFDVIAKPSGAMSLDLAAKKGHDIVKACRRAGGFPA